MEGKEKTQIGGGQPNGQVGAPMGGAGNHLEGGDKPPGGGSKGAEDGGPTHWEPGHRPKEIATR